jgi:hypothetical protein
MATSSGTSVLGEQIVIDNVSTGDAFFTVYIDQDRETPPSRVGYFYLVQYQFADGLGARVVESGIIFRPGRRFGRGSGLFVSSLRFRLWVSWNFEGLDWSIVTGS